MKIAGYLKTSLLDWPGKISSVIFTPGCNFRCPFCHNRDLVYMVGDMDYVSEEKLLRDLKKRKKWIDGLVITGGEPTLQCDLFNFCKKVKEVGMGVKMDTNGSNPDVVADLIKGRLVDYWAMDIKTNPSNYSRVVKRNVDMKQIKTSLELILKSDRDFELRTTIVPKLHTQESLKKAGTWLTELFDKYNIGQEKRVWYWQKFVGRNCLDPKFNELEGYSRKIIKVWQSELKKDGLFIILRGW